MNRVRLKNIEDSRLVSQAIANLKKSIIDALGSKARFKLSVEKKQKNPQQEDWFEVLCSVDLGKKFFITEKGEDINFFRAIQIVGNNLVYKIGKKQSQDKFGIVSGRSLVKKIENK